MEPEDDHAVIGQHPVLDRPGERQAVQLRAIDVVIVHVDDIDPLRRELSFRLLGVDPRCCGHVQAFAGAQGLGFVKQLEVDLAARGAGRAGGAVRLVGNGEIERRARPYRPVLSSPCAGTGRCRR